jgi:class 3 adenylate cyclase
MELDVPDVKYARTGGIAIAYQVVGEGSRDLVYAPHLADIFTLWLTPHFRRFLDRLVQDFRLIVFNPRGTGLSDRPRSLTLEARMDDIAMVLDAVGSPRAALFGVSTSANACGLFAATHPDRCDRLIMANPYPRGLRSDAYPFGWNESEFLVWIRDLREQWGEREFIEDHFLSSLSPALADSRIDFEWTVWQHRLAASPGAVAEFARMAMDTDMTDVLGSIRMPTLILHREDGRGIAEFVRDRIRGAETVELRTQSGSPYSDEAAEALLSFMRGETRPVIPGSVLATVLFTDIVGSTARAAELGDSGWRELLERHRSAVRSELGRYRGIEVDTAGDGFFCRFDGPARAIACAARIIEGARELGLWVRAGIHTGECELVGEKVAGIAVVTGARISSLAIDGEILVSSTVKDLVAGSGFRFEDRGEHELKGVPGTWRLHAVVSV